MSQEIALREATDLSTEVLDLFSEDAGDGLNMGLDDVQIPLISVLQSLSPQVKKSDPKYIKGAEEGQIYNSLTLEVTDGSKGIFVIVAAYKRHFIEWRPRTAGGGKVAEYAIDSGKDKELQAQETAKGIEYFLPNGNTLEDTAEYYVLIFNEDGSVDRAVLPMSKTNLKVSRRLNSLMSSVKMKNAKGQDFTPAIYSQIYKLTTVVQTKGNNSWYIWAVERVGSVKDATVYEAARQFSQAVRKGEISAPSHDQGGVDSADIGKEDVPF